MQANLANLLDELEHAQLQGISLGVRFVCKQTESLAQKRFAAAQGAIDKLDALMSGARRRREASHAEVPQGA